MSGGSTEFWAGTTGECSSALPSYVSRCAWRSGRAACVGTVPMMGPKWTALRKKRTVREVWSEWKVADEAEDAGRAALLASELLELMPESYYVWFQAGLLSKALGNWSESLERNARALTLFTPKDAEEFSGLNPAAWNLGIASTAVGDWATARDAWGAYGLDKFLTESGPIDTDFGLAPVRLNPDESSIPHQALFSTGETAVVWGWRRSPAHAVIASVPLPETGHRFRDVVLHDGEPKGTRLLEGREVSVFDELGRLEESGLPTWQAQVVGASDEDFQVLSELFDQRGLGFDDWSGIRLMCSACSHGAPQDGHDHIATTSTDIKRLGLAGHEADLDEAIHEWLSVRRGINLLNLDLLW